MKLFILGFFLVLSVSSFAGTPYDAFLKSCEFGRGDCSIEVYDASKFNYKVAAKKMVEGMNETQIPYFKRNDVYDGIYSVAGFEDDSDLFFNNLDKLFKTNKVKATFAIAPHPEKCTQSEDCSAVYAVIYTVDGYLIRIYFDYNT